MSTKHAAATKRRPLSVGQIYNTARAAGFGPAAAVIMTAIALAESGGNPRARCHDCFPGVTEDSRGLWQINVDAHPQYASANLADPLTNARAAYAVSGNGRHFTPWSTYTSGAYLAELPKVYAGLGIKHGGHPPNRAPGGMPAPVPSSPGGPTAQDVAAQDAAFPGGNWDPLNWVPNALGAGAEKAAGVLVGGMERVVFTGAGLALGVTLVVIGAWQGFQPARRKVETVVKKAGKAAGAAAAAAEVAA